METERAGQGTNGQKETMHLLHVLKTSRWSWLAGKWVCEGEGSHLGHRAQSLPPVTCVMLAPDICHSCITKGPHGQHLLTPVLHRDM